MFSFAKIELAGAVPQKTPTYMCIHAGVILIALDRGHTTVKLMANFHARLN